MKPVEDNLQAYLKCTSFIDYKHPNIMKLVQQLDQESSTTLDYIKRCFEFVRDEIAHSWDVQDKRITIKASDVLLEGVGVCLSKSNLLAALLRAKRIPCGICYQRLTIQDTPEKGYCIHALNAFYYENRWIRMDARGNNESIHAALNLEEEVLAFQVRDAYGEVDYQEVYAEPLPRVMNPLANARNMIDFYKFHMLQEL
ncbi:transglutaminase superfamily protein [Breznakia blatticola]|uniref:Transglutaminase superfamily protein n=1 Tax=Breznakia blatticola TaxID=1754012 RepID=A0A4R7ZSL0_9FIRM|nr:transglutaminase family protein [Breznakia blatticola]TDW20969.1 transglutaminase superfamily protein [Breznakia blatticola]